MAAVMPSRKLCGAAIAALSKSRLMVSPADDPTATTEPGAPVPLAVTAASASSSSWGTSIGAPSTEGEGLECTAKRTGKVRGGGHSEEIGEIGAVVVGFLHLLAVDFAQESFRMKFLRSSNAVGEIATNHRPQDHPAGSRQRINLRFRTASQLLQMPSIRAADSILHFGTGGSAPAVDINTTIADVSRQREHEWSAALRSRQPAPP